MLPYSHYFKNPYEASFITSVCQFVVSFLIFLLLCVAYAIIEIPENSINGHDIFLSNFQTYFILVSALSFLFPTIFSFILGIGILHKKYKIIATWIIAAMIYSPCIVFGLLGSGIYLIIEGALAVGITAIFISLATAVLMIHSILLVYYTSLNYKDEFKSETISE